MELKSQKGRERAWASEVLQKFGLVVVWILAVIAFSVASPDTYPTLANASNILGSQAVLVILSLGLLLALRAGAYDLSVAAVLTMSGVIVGVLNAEHGWPLLPSILVGLAFGVLVGLVNSIFIVLLGIDSIVVTLGMATLLQGIAIGMTGGETITGLSETLVQYVVGTEVVGIPLEFYYALALTTVMWVIFQYTPGGRRALYVGRSPEVARLSGVNVARVKILALAGAGGISALAGVVYSGTSGIANPTSGLSLLLPAFAAVFLGATSIRVGEFNAWGTLVAAYFLISGVTGLSILGAAAYIQQVFYGGALIVAVTISTLATKRLGQRQAREVGRRWVRLHRSQRPTAGEVE